MKSILRLTGCCAVLAALGACSILPEAEVPEIYLLPAAPASASTTGTVNWSLQVDAPNASRALDSNRIAVIPSGNQLSTYQGVRWGSSAPNVLRDRLIDAFRADGRIKGLSSDDHNLVADLELIGDLRAFQSEYRNGKPEVVIRLEASLARSATQRIVAAQGFEVRESVNGEKVPQVVDAFGKAADKLSAQVVEWTVRQGQREDFAR